jgi:predicted PurR-regulated permease PerM
MKDMNSGAIMWLPISLYLYSTGDTKGAIIVALYSVIVISIIADTFIKPLIKINYYKEQDKRKR